MLEKIRDTEQNNTSGRAIGFVVLLLFGAVVVPGIGVAAPSAADALETRDRALNRLNELEELTATTAVEVDGGVERSIADQIRQGNISYRNGNYSAAQHHYEEAIKQARAALSKAYETRGRRLINASGAHLQKLEARGYDRADISTLREQIRGLQQQEQDINSFGEAQSFLQEAKNIHQQVEQLPDPQFVQFVDSYYTMVIPIQILISVIAALTGAAVMYWYKHEPDDGEEGEEDKEGVEDSGGDTFTPSTLD